MNAAQHILQCITKGAEDDGAVSAALDALREDDGLTLLAAVLEVARIYSAAQDARDLAEAAGYLSAGSEIREALQQAIAAECPVIPPNAGLTIMSEPGNAWPRATDASLFSDGEWFTNFFIQVGAKWVKRVASRLLIERERGKKPPKSRRAR